MTGGVMVFASMVATPVSAFLCPYRWLVFFAVFPLASLAERKLAYFRNFFFIALPPALALVWAFTSHHPESAHRSLRWICAAASGVYFAGALSPRGIAFILGIAGAKRLSDTMLLAGDAASAARLNWRRNGKLPIRERVAVTVRESVSTADSSKKVPVSPGSIPVTVAAVSWLFLLLSLSGRAG